MADINIMKPYERQMYFHQKGKSSFNRKQHGCGMSWRAAVSMEKCFNIIQAIPVIPALTDAISVEDTNLTPKPYSVRMNVKKMGYLSNSKHSLRQDSIIATVL